MTIEQKYVIGQQEQKELIDKRPSLGTDYTTYYLLRPDDNKILHNILFDTYSGEELVSLGELSFWEELDKIN